MSTLHLLRSLFLLPILLAGLVGTGAAPRQYGLRVRFLDSATGYAIQPESVAVRAHQPGAREERLATAQIAASGQTALALAAGRHTITAFAPDHHPMSGEFEMAEGNPYVIHFLLDPLVPPLELQPDYAAALHRDDATIVLGFIVDDESGEPLKEVRVSSAPSGAQAKSDSRGFFQLSVPVQSELEAETAPAKLLFEKPGYQTEARQHLELWPRGDWTYRIRLTRGQGTQTVDEREFRRRLPPSKATAAAPSATAATPALTQLVEPLGTPGPLATAPTNASVRVPRNIRVLKSDNVTIDYVTLDYYCKHVLPAEWIAGWASYSGGSNSLNAGAVALRTYAIGYINSPRSSTYDICGTTSCQVYGSTTSSYSDTAVNFTANYVEISSSGTIPSGLTEYSAENNQLGAACGDGFTAPTGGCLYDPVCAGESTYGHGRGMCQWGTARWATGNRMAGRVSSDARSNGYPRRDWVWICRHYYPNLTLVKGAPLMAGDDVRALSTVNVRACTGGSITNGTGCGVVATKSAGAAGTIIGGPTLVTNDGGGYTWYQVQWSDGAVGWSVENYLERVFPLPTAPVSLSATPAGTNQINLTWTDTASTETGFKVERSVVATGPWLHINTVVAGITAYADKSLPMGSTWFYRVRAYNAGGNSDYSAVASATTASVPPVLGAVGDKTIFEGSTLLVTNTAIAPEAVQLLTDFEPFMTETANGVVLFREPRNSVSTSAFVDAAPNLAAITDVFSTAGNASTRALRINCNFTNGNNPWLRLTTASAATFPNPVIDLTKHLRFSVYADKPIQVAVGCRETTTAAGTALGSDGGITGAIEWVGVTNVAGTAPMPTHTVNAGTWTTLTFDLPNEPIRSFSGGNGVLATASGLGVLEHLAIVPAAGAGVYNVYLDSFAVVAPRALTYSLGPGAPAGATLHPPTGLFTWTPTETQGPSTNTVAIIVTDDSVPPLSATNTFTVVVLSKPTLQAVSRPDGGFTLTWEALPGATYRVQYKTDLADAGWMDLGTAVIASGSTESISDTMGAAQRFYRVVVNQ